MTQTAIAQSQTEPEMAWIPGGSFMMGSTRPDARPDERPVHRVRVDGFWMGVTEVTNAQFAEFVRETGYVTTAERAVDWEELRTQLPPGTPKPSDDMLAPGSLVFTFPEPGTDPRDVHDWWAWTIGASWRAPEGPGSTIEGRENYPVVHVSHDDALAYCEWAGGRLPTESEWELAARGGLPSAHFVWGEQDIDPSHANVWQGEFPVRNTQEDGYLTTAPVASFPANGFGLHDMAGNVWEWCSDQFRVDEYSRRRMAAGPKGTVSNPQGPSSSRDPRNPNAPVSRVQRGGSFLCHASYCSSYRPSARMGCTPDTGMAHVGFRLVRDVSDEFPPPASGEK